MRTSPKAATLRVIAGTFMLAVPAMAHADPCTGPLPQHGTQFGGVARYVGDGDGLCVGPKDRPDQWIEVRLDDFNPPELKELGGERAKHLLAATTMSKSLTCRAGRRSYDRIVATCTLAGRPLGNELRRRGGVEGGR